MILSLLTSFFNPAHAFCGTFVGGADSDIYNKYSQAAIVRKGEQTTLTIENDVQGEFSDFAMIIPVPYVLPEDSIHVIEPSVFDNLDAYSQPRLVRYECSDFTYEMENDLSFEDSADTPASDTGGGVNVEAQYIVGEYEIVILSATESENLFDWFNNNDYQLPGQAIPMLEQYIASGSVFLAARVSSEAGISSGDVLSPLQFQYESASFGLPIRIGTLNSKDAQDLVMYLINDYSLGETKISNYPEFTVEDECMWETQGEEFGQYYADVFSDGYDEQDDGSYIVEYSWGGGGCDPCPSDPPSGDDLISLGVDEESIHYSDYYFTRLHMRYTPTEATEDLMFYHSNMMDASQIRYIEYESFLEDRFPVCGLGLVDNPGSCEEYNTYEGDRELSSSCNGGCSAGGAEGVLALWFVGVIAGLRRKE